MVKGKKKGSSEDSPNKDTGNEGKGASLNANIELSLKNLTESIAKMNNSIVGISDEIKEIRCELETIKEIKDSVNFTQKSLIEAEKNIAILQQTVKHYEEKFQDLSGQLLTYKSQNAVLEDSVLSLDTYIRRENLKFSGVVEDQREKFNRSGKEHCYLTANSETL